MSTRERKIGSLLLAPILLALNAAVVSADITGSKHDFSGDSWSGGEICIVCHTPHDADQTLVNTPLWNHQLASTTYNLYSSSTMDATVEQPTGVSKLCLSCHDGTVAVDSFGGNDGSMFNSGSSNLGTDLSDDHPVGITWNHQTVGGANGCTANCHDMQNDPYAYEVVFYEKKIQCATCHDPHNNTPETHMLRITLAGSELCLRCHTDKL